MPASTPWSRWSTARSPTSPPASASSDGSVGARRGRRHRRGGLRRRRPRRRDLADTGLVVRVAQGGVVVDRAVLEPAQVFGVVGAQAQPRTTAVNRRVVELIGAGEE